MASLSQIELETAIEGLSSLTIFEDVCPPFLADPADGRYIDLAYIKYACMLTLYQKGEKEYFERCPLWMLQIRSTFSARKVGYLNQAGHEDFWTVYTRQRTQLGLAGSPTLAALRVAFFAFDGLYENGKNKNWELFVYVVACSDVREGFKNISTDSCRQSFRKELANQLYDKDFCEFAPNGMVDCGEHGDLDLGKYWRTFDSEFKSMNCWPRWLHRYFRANNAVNSPNGFTELHCKAHIFRKRIPKEKMEVDYSSWPIVHKELWPKRPIDYSLVLEDNKLDAEQLQEYQAYQHE